MHILFNHPTFLVSSPPTELTGSLVAWYLIGITLFVILNAIYVAAEFALLKVRISQVEAMIQEYPKKAKRILLALGNLNGYLSACQLGITIASLALGALGEPFVAMLIQKPLEVIMGDYPGAMRIVSYLIATGTFAAVHVVIGEQVPKVLAIRKPVETSLKLINFLHFFYFAFGWAVNVLNNVSNWILLKIFKVEPAGHEEVHSAEEIAQFVEQSEKHDQVTETEREILINALELNDVLVKDVMTPRSEVIVMDVDDTMEKTIDVAIKTQHTRFPLVKGHLDDTVGLVHIKDIFTILNDEKPDLMSIRRELKVVPETMPLDVLLKFFQSEHEHLAMVVDEFGDPAGLVFMDNVIEELVGDIHDEFDDEISSFTRVNETEFVVEGSLTLNELSDHEPEIDISSTDVTTVGGYVTQQMGRIPDIGETIEIEGFSARVTSTDGRRVGQLHFSKLEELVEEEESDIK